MGRRTPNEEKALAWYCEVNDLIPQLSTHPICYFRDKDGNEVSARLEHIVMNWETSRKDAARIKKLEQRRTA